MWQINLYAKRQVNIFDDQFIFLNVLEVWTDKNRCYTWSYPKDQKAINALELWMIYWKDCDFGIRYQLESLY